MRIMAVNIPDDEFEEIRPWIECDRCENPFEEEHIFYNPSVMFEWRMRLRGYTLGVREEND